MNLEERVAAIDWWHGGINLGTVTTQGRTYPGVTLLPRLQLPDDLTGKTVLDIGAWDGYMSFECEKRGANVTAVDSYAWEKPDKMAEWHKTGRDGFDLARDILDSRVEPVKCDVLALDAKWLGTFDIVLFLGVLYHMRHPLLALEKVAALCDDLLIVESHTDMEDVDYPAMRFYPGGEINGDPTNWWGPNPKCIEAMLHDVGFAQVEIRLVLGGRAVLHARKAI